MACSRVCADLPRTCEFGSRFSLTILTICEAIRCIFGEAVHLAQIVTVLRRGFGSLIGVSTGIFGRFPKVSALVHTHVAPVPKITHAPSLRDWGRIVPQASTC